MSIFQQASGSKDPVWTLPTTGSYQTKKKTPCLSSDNSRRSRKRAAHQKKNKHPKKKRSKKKSYYSSSESSGSTSESSERESNSSWETCSDSGKESTGTPAYNSASRTNTRSFIPQY
ncbi:MAG: ORF3 [Torque teno virus AZ6_5]|nr:MAG: ORF3 [Torque teno virus AZ6_5]